MPLQIRYLNRGSYGFVVLARNKSSGEQFALKFIERGLKITHNVEREILNHKKLHHPYVIELEDVFRTDGYLVLVLEYASGGSLRKYLSTKGPLPEDEARKIFQQLMLAVDYCHKMGQVLLPYSSMLGGKTNLPIANRANISFSNSLGCPAATLNLITSF